MERSSNQWSRGQVETNKSNKIRVLRSKENFVNIQIGWNINQRNRDYANVLKKLDGKYDLNSRGFELPLSKLEEALAELRNCLKKDGLEEHLENIPDYVNRYLSDIDLPLTFKIKRVDQNIKENIRLHYNLENESQRSLDDLSLEFRENLYEFQKESIKFGIKKFGRLLIGDEMGVGKTIQALGLCEVYREDWPFLVIAPSSLRFNWQKESLKWLRLYLKDLKDPIQIIWKKSDGIDPKARGVVVSYDLAKMMANEIEKSGFRVIVCDEAHYLKSIESQRTMRLLPILQKAKRVILLTGTPALARPIELYPLLSAIRPDVFPFHDIKEYGHRYCAPEFNRHSRRLEYKGCDNSEELYFVLSHLMIRRLKKQVLSQLPDKIRQVFDIKGSPAEIKEIKELTKKLERETGKNLDQLLEQRVGIEGGGGGSGGGGGGGGVGGGGFENMFSITSKVYEITARAKINGVIEFLKDYADYNIKIIIFAHHTCMLDALEEFAKEELAKKKKKYIRIDGSTKPHLRGQYAEQFQNEPDCYYALLSITAASTGFTLTKASTVVFAELNWTPANMEQAEARAHRIGQSEVVTVYYMLAKDTIDQSMFEMIKKKTDTTGKILDGENAQTFTYQDHKSKNQTLNSYFAPKELTQNGGTFKDGLSKVIPDPLKVSREVLGPTSFAGIGSMIEKKSNTLSRMSEITDTELKELEELEAEVINIEKKVSTKVKVPSQEEREQVFKEIKLGKKVEEDSRRNFDFGRKFIGEEKVKLSQEEIKALDIEGELDDIL